MRNNARVGAHIAVELATLRHSDHTTGRGQTHRAMTGEGQTHRAMTGRRQTHRAMTGKEQIHRAIRFEDQGNKGDKQVQWVESSS